MCQPMAGPCLHLRAFSNHCRIARRSMSGISHQRIDDFAGEVAGQGGPISTPDGSGHGETDHNQRGNAFKRSGQLFKFDAPRIL